MLDGVFSDLTTDTLAKCLDAVGFKHRVIADNIANVETPGFKRSEVNFEGQLRSALSSGSEETAEARIRTIQAQAQVDYSSPSRPDGNNVSIDREMAEMTKNTLQYESLVQLMELKGSMIRSAITEGRR
jgi:flagellar basal-body rod protein FlgB